MPPREVLFDLEPGVIDALRASLLGELFRSRNLMNENAGAGTNWAKAHYTEAGHELC
jgi:tubulin beta